MCKINMSVSISISAIFIYIGNKCYFCGDYSFFRMIATVYRQIYCRKFWSLSDQMAFFGKCIRIVVVCCDRNDIILVKGIIFAFCSLMLWSYFKFTSYFKIIHDA